MRQQLRRSAGKPLLTHYDGASRVELSYATYANWVDKTCNLLDTLLVEPGDPVDLRLLDSNPGHWVTLVWLLACWQYGCPVKQADRPAALRVGGPDIAADETPGVACSLDPLGRGLAGSAPPGCIDYAEVLAEPDDYFAAPQSATDAAWGRLTHAEVAATPPRDNRALFVDPAADWPTVQQLIVSPLLGGGSSVIATNCSATTLAQLRRDERIG